MNVNVVTPFSRHENFKALASMLESQGVSRWILLGRRGERHPKHPLVESIFFDAPEGDAGMILTNKFVQTYHFQSDERYCFLMDDDWYPPGFVSEVSKHDEPLLVCSMKRGDCQPPNAKHPCWALIAGKHNLHYGHVGFEQGMFSGHVLNSLAHGTELNDHSEDLIIRASSQFETKFLPSLFIWFNWFEDGRWSK